jgi:hypothetical protein
MATKHNAKAVSSGCIAAEEIGVKGTPEQKRLVQNKMEVLQKARALQIELANVRAEIARLDQEMLRANLCYPVLACW